MAWVWQQGGGGAQSYTPGRWVWVEDAPVVPPPTSAPPPAPAPAPGTSSGSPGGMFGSVDSVRRRIGGSAQEGVFEGGASIYNPARDPLMYRLPGDAQGEGSYRPIRDQAFEQARIKLLYDGDDSLAMRLLDEATEDEYNTWFSPAALQKEIARLQEPESDRGFIGKTMGDLGDHGTIEALTKMALAWMFGQGVSGLTSGVNASNAAAVESGTVGAEGAALESAALNKGMLANAAGNFGTKLAFSGDPRSAALGTAVPMAVSYGADLAAPYITQGIDAGVDWWNELDFGDAPVAADDLRRMQFADAGTSMTDVSAPMMPPAGATAMTGAYPMPAAIPTSTAEQAASTLGSPAFLPGYDEAYGGLLSSAMLPASDLDQQDAQNLEELEAGDTPPATDGSNVTSQDLQRLVKVGKTVYNLLGQEEGVPPEGAPEQGESPPEQYAGELGQYLGLSAEEMAEQGFEPGSPEQYQYIMSRADQVIADVLGDMDVDAEDFAQQLRAKTDAELQQLQRALYVRGQMGQLMGSGTYIDPATGEAEEVIGEGMFNPGAAAYQQGLAGDVEELGGLRGQDAMSYLNKLLGRDVDFYGMQGAADARFEQAKREEDDLRRRRGMFGGF